MKILFVNDPHFAEAGKHPSSRKSTYLDEISAKILECKEIAKDCDLTIFTGDIFHHPRANAVSHFLVSHITNLLKDWPTKIYAVPGNHDLSESGFSGIARQPIYVLSESGIINLFHQQGLWLDDNTYSMFYGWDNNDLGKYKVKRPYGCKNFVLVCHDMLCPDKSYPFEYLPYSEISSITDYDYIFYGHVHWDSGAQKINNTIFVNSGSLSRVARNEDNINRIPRVSIAYFDDAFSDISFLTLKSAKLPGEIFVAPKETLSATGAQFSDFVTQIGSAAGVEIIDLEDYIVNLPIEEKIKEKIWHYIQ
mgnify:CR=1 FL=1